MSNSTSLNKYTFLLSLDDQMHYVEYMYNNGDDQFPDGSSYDNTYIGKHYFTFIYTPGNKLFCASVKYKNTN